MKNVLISGANGFVGKHLLHFLQNNTGEEINTIGLTRTPSLSSANLVTLDLLDDKATSRFLSNSELNIDIIIHLASIIANADNLNNVNILTANTKITGNILKIAEANNVKHLINMSSSSVYSNSDGSYTEQSPINPSTNSDTLYGLSKFNSEVLIDYFLRGTNTKVTHLRTAMIYGKGMDKTRIIPTIERELLEKGKVILFGNGKRSLNLIEINRLIFYITQIIANPFEGILNIADEYKSTLQVAEDIILKHKLKNAEIILQKAGNASNFHLDCSKLKSLYGI